tara:strand:- start:7049 stop:7684 length:636 start_codon:yes stop_codon:yes gene_type:complete
MKFSGKKSYVSEVQRFFPELEDDGIAGRKTWKTLRKYFRGAETTVRQKSKGLAEIMVALAHKEVGVEEINGSNKGPRVNQYKSATWLDSQTGWPWCAAFICWLYREAMERTDANYSFLRPRTAGAWDFENWSKNQDASVHLAKPHKGDIQAGDVVCFTFSHIGLAIGSPDSNGYVKTIEGNTDSSGSREGGGVFEKRRHISKIRSRIRTLV